MRIESIISLVISILLFIGAYFIRIKYVFELVGYLKGNKLIEQINDKNKLAKDFSYVYICSGSSFLAYSIITNFFYKFRYSIIILELGLIVSIFLESYFRKKLKHSLY